MGLLMALGEEPNDYQQMMESLLEDLDPRPGLETHLAGQMGDTFWRMRRVQNMRDGLALKNIQSKVQGEQMVATMQASKVIDMVEPFERLQEALAPRGQGPTAADGSAGSSVCASSSIGGLLLAADVAPHQRLREGPAGNTGKQKNK
jgi:hypothetical protein